MMAFAKKNLTSSTLPVWHKPRSPIPVVGSSMPPDPLCWVNSTYKLVYGDTRGVSSVASVADQRVSGMVANDDRVAHCCCVCGDTVRWCMFRWSEQSWRLSCIDGATMVYTEERREFFV